MKLTSKLNRRERKARQLLAHYATCERLGKYLGMPKPDGKKISVALWKLERIAHAAHENLYSGEISIQACEQTEHFVILEIRSLFPKLPPGFFINSDPRGYSLQIDCDTEEGQALIEAVKLHTYTGGFGILSPEINGN